MADNIVYFRSFSLISSFFYSDSDPPPLKNELLDIHHKSMFLGATKYDILSYLVDAKDRIDPEEQILSYTYKFLQRSGEESTIENTSERSGKNINSTKGSNRIIKEYKMQADKSTASIERNDSGVGSETSKCSRTKYLPGTTENIIPPIHLCEDCGM